MIEINLPHGVWKYNENKVLGKPGGFGFVFEGISKNGEKVAIKKLKQGTQNSAQREMRICSEFISKSFKHIVPVFDEGFDEISNSNYIVMARADKSLQDEINTRGIISEKESIDILCQIITGLLEVSQIVHRDIKPGNILFHDGLWKISDFGIARFVEETTSLQTLKDCLSPYYAAPEQWKSERSTSATDVYALGCVGYYLVTGNPPFNGSVEELREKHLSDIPQVLNIDSKQLSILIDSCLRKIPNTRPTLQTMKERIEVINRPVDVTKDQYKELSSAASKISFEESKNITAIYASMQEENDRKELSEFARKILTEIRELLFKQIIVYSQIAQINISRDEITLGKARIKFMVNAFPILKKEDFPLSHLDVITGGIINLYQSAPIYEWGSNLWYLKYGGIDQYRWWEMSYMDSPLMRVVSKYEPHFVNDTKKADLAATSITSEIQFGSKPKLIDEEEKDDFCSRWINLFSKASIGELSYPSRLPLG